MNQSFDRQELDYNRMYLSQALDHWSVARQPNYWPALTHLALPLEWHVGAFDPTYVAIAKQAQKINSHINLHIHPNQGHRLLIF